MAENPLLFPELPTGVLDSLLASPPSSAAQLRRVVEGLDPASVREEAVRRLETGDIEPGRRPLVSAILSLTGPGSATPRLHALAVDSSRDLWVRSAAFCALPDEGASSRGAVLDRLAPADAGELLGFPLREIMGRIPEDPATARELAADLARVDEPLRTELFQVLERYRREEGVPAITAWGEALRRSAPSGLHERMVEAIVADGSAASEELLKELRDNSREKAARRLFQGALIRLQTRRTAATGTRTEIEGYALAAPCDGLGAFILLGIFERPRGDDFVNLCIRAAQGIRDGFVLRGQSHREREELLLRFRTGLAGGLVRISLGQAATLAMRGLETGRALGHSPPAGARPALEMFEKACRPDEGDLPEVAPARTAPARRLSALLDRPIYDSWFLDRADLRSKGVHVPQRVTPTWLREAAPKLNGPPLTARLVGMARYMALWHFWNAEPEEASLLSRAARDLESRFEASALVNVLLRRSVDIVGPEEIEDLPSGVAVGDVNLRALIRDRFLERVDRPLGRHLAQLDFTEAARLESDRIFQRVPGELRPADDDGHWIAFEAARLFADALTLGNREMEEVFRTIEGVLRKKLGLDEEQASAVARGFVGAMVSFAEDVCGRCPVRCLDAPAKRMDDLFFFDDHPADPDPRRRRRTPPRQP
jgi:hypothetical protein